MGGDEFVILLADTDPDEVNVVLTKMHKRILQLAEETRFPIGISIGACIMEHAHTDVEALLACVDALMYEAKKAGKNQLRLRTVETCPSDVEPPRASTGILLSRN
jgi:diguanylate cyclase (GGDEF)-like protein